MTPYNSLIQAMMGQVGPQPTRAGGNPNLARAMAGKSRPGDAKYARLGALPPYAESQFAGSFGHNSGNAPGAFQSDAFQDDAYQVF